MSVVITSASAARKAHVEAEHAYDEAQSKWKGCCTYSKCDETCENTIAFRKAEKHFKVVQAQIRAYNEAVREAGERRLMQESIQRATARFKRKEAEKLREQEVKEINIRRAEERLEAERQRKAEIAKAEALNAEAEKARAAKRKEQLERKLQREKELQAKHAKVRIAFEEARNKKSKKHASTSTESECKQTMTLTVERHNELVLAGKTAAEIASEAGLTKQKVYQMRTEWRKSGLEVVVKMPGEKMSVAETSDVVEQPEVDEATVLPADGVLSFESDVEVRGLKRELDNLQQLADHQKYQLVERDVRLKEHETAINAFKGQLAEMETQLQSLSELNEKLTIENAELHDALQQPAHDVCANAVDPMEEKYLELVSITKPLLTQFLAKL